MLPHDSVNHLHDDFIDDLEEVNHHAAFFADRSKDSPKGQAEENDSQGVCAGPVGHGLSIFDVRCISLKSRIVLHYLNCKATFRLGSIEHICLKLETF